MGKEDIIHKELHNNHKFVVTETKWFSSISHCLALTEVLLLYQNRCGTDKLNKALYIYI